MTVVKTNLKESDIADWLYVNGGVELTHSPWCFINLQGDCVTIIKESANYDNNIQVLSIGLDIHGINTVVSNKHIVDACDCKIVEDGIHTQLIIPSQSGGEFDFGNFIGED